MYKLLVTNFRLYFKCVSANMSSKHLRIVLYCSRVPTANASGCTAVGVLLYKPWSLVVPNCTARCLHQRP